MVKLTDGLIRFTIIFAWLHTIIFIILIISLNIAGISPGGFLDSIHLLKFWNSTEAAQSPSTTPTYIWYPNSATTTLNGTTTITWRGPGNSFTVPAPFAFPATNNTSPIALHILALLLAATSALATACSTFRSDTRSRSRLNFAGVTLAAFAWLFSLAAAGVITAKLVSRSDGLTAGGAPVTVGFGGVAVAIMWGAQVLVLLGIAMHVAGLVLEKRARARKAIEEAGKNGMSLDSSSE